MLQIYTKLERARMQRFILKKVAKMLTLVSNMENLVKVEKFVTIVKDYWRNLFYVKKNEDWNDKKNIEWFDKKNIEWIDKKNIEWNNKKNIEWIDKKNISLYLI